MPCKLSIIIPCLNEEANIEATLKPLQTLRERGHEIILGDASSTDNTVTLATSLCDKIISCEKGRAAQMNAGANEATGDILCFIHADTLCPENLDRIIIHELKTTHYLWGHFNIKLSSSKPVFRLIESLINIRSCITGIASGDQGIFIYRHIFKRLSGYSPIPLMEDIEISRRLKKISKPVCIKNRPLITSSRRWEKHGVLRTVLLMWTLRLKYSLGTPAEKLVTQYPQHDS